MNKKHIGSLMSLFCILLSISDMFTAAMGTVLAWAGTFDVKKRIIPNIACVLVMLMGFFEIIFSDRSVIAMKALKILIMLLLILIIKLILSDKIGMGDIKLIMASAFCMEPVSLLWALGFACLGAGIIGLIITKTIKGEVPLGPFLAVSLTLFRMAEAM